MFADAVMVLDAADTVAVFVGTAVRVDVGFEDKAAVGSPRQLVAHHVNVPLDLAGSKCAGEFHRRSLYRQEK